MPSRSRVDRWARTALSVNPTERASSSTDRGPRRNRVTSCPRVVSRKRWPAGDELMCPPSGDENNVAPPANISNKSTNLLTNLVNGDKVRLSRVPSIPNAGALHMRNARLAATALVAGATFFLAPALAAQMPSPALDDATIVAIFDAANTADIETGKLAVERGSTRAVREYGEMLVRDHSAVRQQGRDLAARLKVTPTPPADDAGAKSHA